MTRRDLLRGIDYTKRFKQIPTGLGRPCDNLLWDGERYRDVFEEKRNAEIRLEIDDFMYEQHSCIATDNYDTYDPHPKSVQPPNLGD